MIVPELLNGVLYGGVFDGHAEEGGVVAERAAQTLGHELASTHQCLAHVFCTCIHYTYKALSVSPSLIMSLFALYLSQALSVSVSLT